MKENGNQDAASNGPDDDEISLYDLYAVLVRQKKVIFISIMAVLILCIGYLVLTTKIYQVNVTLLPPFIKDLNLANLDNGYTVKNVFEEIKTELRLVDNWKTFEKANKELLMIESTESDSIFEHPVEITQDKNFPGTHIQVNYKHKSRENVSTILQKYIQYVKTHYVENLLQQASSTNRNEIEKLTLEIMLARDTAKIRRQDKMLELQENIKIAEKLGITENSYYSLKSKNHDPKALTILTSNISAPSYLKGVKTLRAELEQLKDRTSDDPFVAGLREKQARLARLQAIVFSPEKFIPFRIDGEVSAPEKVKPKTILVLALGIVLGGMLGFFVAFFSEFVQKARQTTS